LGGQVTAKTNGRVQDEQVHIHSHCIVSCGWLDLEDHGDYCERAVGSRATAVTEPGWTETQIWCSVISSYIRGTVPLSYNQDCNRYRNGVQATIQARGEITIDRESEAGWSKVRFNFTPAEARQLAAQLTAAADSHDGIGQCEFIMRRLEKIAEHVGAEIWGTR
jgi:hypothetical protein